MSIAHLLDHTCRVWQLQETVTGTLRTTERGYTIVPGQEALSCGVRRQDTRITQINPGVAPQGFRKVYFDGNPPMKERNVIDIYIGPDAPTRLRIESMTYPRGHHTEVVCTEFLEDLPPVIES